MSTKVRPPHLPQRAQQLRLRPDDAFSLQRFLDFLSQEEVITKKTAIIVQTPAELLADEFRSYLRKERALAETTIIYYLEFISRFLRVYHCLLGLLVVSGMRIGEAIRLKLEDVDLSQGVLTARGTKFGKSRLIPLHPSTQQILGDYKLRRDDFLAGRPALYFFVSQRGNHLDIGEVHRTFYKLSRQVGLRGPDSSKGPRLHDFRHRFAVETLLQWYRTGEDVERRLPILSTYLGHVHVSDTYWYLTACPELMGLAVERLERRWGVIS